MSRLIDALVVRAEDAIQLPGNAALNTSDPNQAVGQIINRLAEFLIALAFPLAIAAIVYSAYTLLVSQGKPEAFEKTKKNILYMVTGMFFMIFAVILVRVVYNALSLN